MADGRALRLEEPWEGIGVQGGGPGGHKDYDTRIFTARTPPASEGRTITSNPCDALERPKATPATPRGITGDDIRRLLAVVPNTRVGLRDRAIILTLTLTWRRRYEVINLRTGDLSSEGSTVFYVYRGTGGKQGRRSTRSWRGSPAQARIWRR